MKIEKTIWLYGNEVELALRQYLHTQGVNLPDEILIYSIESDRLGLRISYTEDIQNGN